MLKVLPKNLAYIRQKKGMTQKELANQLNKNPTTISGWENDISEPSIKDLVEISYIFGVSVDFLLKSDLSEGKVIDEVEFNKKGKVSGKVMGKVMPENQNPDKDIESLKSDIERISKKLDNLIRIRRQDKEKG